MAARTIFRQESLDRLQSPEDLGQLLLVVNRKSYVAIAALGLLVAAGLAWSLFGSIPITVDGFGVLVNPGNIKGLQSPAGGQIAELRVRAGQKVQKGQVLAVFNQVGLEQQLIQERARLAEVLRQNAAETQMDEQHAELERKAIDNQRELVLTEIRKSNELAQRVRQETRKYTDRQRENLESTRKMTSNLAAGLRKRQDALHQLRREGLSADDVVLQSESDVMANELRKANLDVQAQELALKDLEHEQTELQRQGRQADLELKLLELKMQEQRLDQELLHNRWMRELKEKELRRSIDQEELQFKRQREVTAEYDGIILELVVSAGQVISPGQRLGTIDLQSESAALANVSYFAVKDGKQIQVNDRIDVTPANVQRERYGSIIGRVTHVSPYPVTAEGAVNVVGNSDLAGALLKQGGAIEIEAELERDPKTTSGFRWTSQGPPMTFSSGTTATVRVTIEQRRPITYLLPLLRTWVFGEKDEVQPKF